MLRRRSGPVARAWPMVCAAAIAALALAGGCDWFNDPVAANLPPETEMVTCPGAGAVMAGDDVLLEWGGTDLDGSVARFRWTLDGSVAEETEDTFLLISDVTEGEHVFTVAAVDNEGEVDSTPAVCDFIASEAGGLVDRVVLAELLTTKFCSNCWKAELALDRMVHQYGADAICVIAYHYDDDDQIPPDPVATDESNARCDWYYENTDVGVYYAVFPLTIFDGGRFVVGADDTTSTKAAYAFETDLRLAVGSPISLSVDGGITSGRGDVRILVRVHEALTGGPNVVRAVVVEDGIVSGSYHFDFVARDLLEPETLTASAVGDSMVVERTFTLDPSWNTGELDVIAFVQDESTGEILQSARLTTE